MNFNEGIFMFARIKKREKEFMLSKQQWKKKKNHETIKNKTKKQIEK